MDEQIITDDIITVTVDIGGVHDHTLRISDKGKPRHLPPDTAMRAFAYRKIGMEIADVTEGVVLFKPYRGIDRLLAEIYSKLGDYW